MANITLNIEGDLNIYVSEEDGQPDSLYLDGMDGVPETLRIHLEADGEDDESKAERTVWSCCRFRAFSSPLTAMTSSSTRAATAILPVPALSLRWRTAILFRWMRRTKSLSPRCWRTGLPN